MRIESLRLSAVGPYPGTHEIDFAKLGGSALFLIDGPTGAGKTAIIDAIVFALYGQVSGDADAKEKLRSSHASAMDPTEVELKFTVTAGTFVVRRRPEYERPKRRAEGMRVEKATCSVDRVNADGSVVNIASQIRAANMELSKLVGLEGEQFRQTVVLPQGQFADFLKSNSLERKPILQRIFATEKFERIERILAQRAREAHGHIDECTNDANTAIDTFVGRHSLTEETRVELKLRVANGGSASMQMRLDQVVADFKERKDEKAAAVVPLQKRRDADRYALEQRKSEAEAQLEMESALDRMEIAQAELGHASKELASGHPRALQDLDLAIDDLADYAKHANNVKTTADAIRDLQVALSKEREVLDKQLVLDDRNREVGELKTQISLLTTKIDTDLPAEIALLRAELRQASEAETKLPEAKRELNAAIEARSGRTAVAAAGAKLENAETILAACKTDLDGARKDMDVLRDTRMANAAADLAAELKDGEPCPVCGGTTHPRLARRLGDAVTEREIRDARERVQKTEEEVRSLEGGQREASQDLTAAQTTLAGLGSAAEADAEQLRVRVENLDTQAAGVQSLNQEIEYAEKQRDLSFAQKTDKAGTLAAAKRDVETLSGAIHEAQEVVGRTARGFQTVAARNEALSALASALRELGGYRAAVEQAGGVEQRARDVLTALRVHDEFAATDAAQNALDRSEFELSVAQADLANLETAIQDSEIDSAGILARLRQREQTVADADVLMRLNDYARGENRLNMTLSTYVLTSLFGDVVEAANVRLQGMLEGRYSLRASETANDLRRRAGLDLMIHDGHTGSERAVSSLSGGEKFCVSLALALGLAEIVQSNAGGIAIDTLFIDEGFGTLDGSRLNDVMNVLTGIKAHGRTVGLISHVESMKSQISEKITAVPNLESGASTLTVSWM